MSCSMLSTSCSHRASSSVPPSWPRWPLPAPAGLCAGTPHPPAGWHQGPGGLPVGGGGTAPGHKGGGCPWTAALDICCHPWQLCPFPSPGSGAGTPCGCTSGTLEPQHRVVPTLMPGTAAFSTSRVTRMKPRRLSPPGSVMIVSRFLHKRAKNRNWRWWWPRIY